MLVFFSRFENVSEVKKVFCYQKLFWPFTDWINCLSDLKNFANSRPSASNFKSFSRSQEQFFLEVGQNNFFNKIPLPKIWTENFHPRIPATMIEVFCLFFGRIENKIICLWNVLTFSIGWFTWVRKNLELS